MSVTDYRSRVYTDRPAYADFDAPAKFQAVISIIARRLREHPKAICSYSGGADSDIMLDLIERTRAIHHLPPVKYAFFNTGLEMEATKRHVREVSEKYGVEIQTFRPKVNIVMATRKYGVPFMTKIISQRLNEWQTHNCEVPFNINEEFDAAEDKRAKLEELFERYPNQRAVVGFLLGCNRDGTARKLSQLNIKGTKYLKEFILESPPDFKISAKCCKFCKKQLAHGIQKDFDMVITGERKAEGGIRTITTGGAVGCFGETTDGQYRLRPLYYVSDKDKAWYKSEYGIKYSDAHEVYGLKRTGCCGCPISYRAVDDLEAIRPYEPNIVKAAWNVFGKSYEYRRQYNEYKARRREEEKERRAKEKHAGQVNLFEEAQG